MQINSAFPQGPMNLLDRLKQAEAAATPGPWERHAGDTIEGPPVFVVRNAGGKTAGFLSGDAEFIVAFRNHAADLIRLVEAAHDAWYMDRDPQLKEALAPFLAEEDAR